MTDISLAPGADSNGLATMLADLVRQNLESKPHKKKDFDAISGNVAIVAEDAEVALTMRFDEGRLVIHDGIVGIPDVTLRGGSDTILALSNFPLTRLGGRVTLPLPDPRDKAAVATLKSVMADLTRGRFHIYGMAFHLPMLMRLTRVMSVNG